MAITEKAVPVILASNSLRRLWPVSSEHSNYALKGVNGNQSPLYRLLSAVKKNGGFDRPLVFVQEQALKPALAIISSVFNDDAITIATRSDVSSGVLCSLAARIQAKERASSAMVFLPATLATPDDDTMQRYLKLLVNEALNDKAGEDICFLAAKSLEVTRQLQFHLQHQPTKTGRLPVKAVICENDPHALADISLDQSFGVQPTGPAIARASAISKLLVDKAPTVLQACSHALDTGEKIGNILRPNPDFLTLAGQISLADVIANSPERAQVLMCGNDIETVRDWASKYAKRPTSELISVQSVGTGRHDVISYDDRVLVVESGHATDVDIVDHQSSQVDDYHITGRRITRIESQEGAAVWKICLEPGQRLENECHFQRIESWNIVSGKGLAHLDDVSIKVQAGSTLIISPEVCHQIENTGDGPLVFYEMRMGRMMEDDDRLYIPSRVGRSNRR